MTVLAIFRSIIAARRHGLMRLRAANRPLRLDCLAEECGLCCQVFGGAITIRPNEKDALVQINAATSDSRGTVLRHSGTRCSLLKDNLCAIYDTRPRSCREYPWYLIQGQLYYDSGCPGIKSDVDGRPDVRSLTTFREYVDSLPQFAQRFVEMFLTRW